MPWHARLGYRPALDGLRAVAVVAVLLYHADVSWMRGGYLGVDLFFVLSGFLITTLLLEEDAAEGKVSLRGFWMRRARRLLPALFLVLAAVALYGAIRAEGTDLNALRGDALATLGYASNWHFIATDQSYFAQFNGPSPLHHTWSLAIEEQFYLVWPLVLPLAWKVVRRRRAGLGVLIGAGALASVAWMAIVHQPGDDPSRAYYGTDTRAFTLLIGAVFAVVFAGRPNIASPRLRRVLTTASVPLTAGILASFVFVDSSATWMYEGGFALVAAAAAVVIMGAVQGGLLTRILQTPPLPAIGRISYGLYLWHWPVFVVVTPGRSGLEGGSLLLVRLAITLGLAITSYVLVEMPIRSGVLGRGLRWIGPALTPALVAGLVVTTAGASPTGDHELGEAQHTRAPKIVESAREIALERPARVMVVGDSVAETFGWGFGDAAKLNGLLFWNQAHVGCGLAESGRVMHGGAWRPVPIECAAWVDHWASAVAEFDPDVTFVLFDVFVLGDVDVGGQLLSFGTPQSDGYLIERLDRGVQALTASGGRVVLLTAPYNHHGAQVPDRVWEEDDRGRVDHYNGLLRTYAAAHPDMVKIGDLNQMLCPGGQCMEMIAGQKARWDDGVHFMSNIGSWAFGWLRPHLRVVAESSDERSARSVTHDS